MVTPQRTQHGLRMPGALALGGRVVGSMAHHGAPPRSSFQKKAGPSIPGTDGHPDLSGRTWRGLNPADPKRSPGVKTSACRILRRDGDARKRVSPGAEDGATGTGTRDAAMRLPKTRQGVHKRRTAATLSLARPGERLGGHIAWYRPRIWKKTPYRACRVGEKKSPHRTSYEIALRCEDHATAATFSFSMSMT